ncbi:hypothetical protein V6N11_016161 [Hibiscus sabdariffa]|uniref:Pentatricopeptide repeat-containing protein n=1 Tax=Hibiscus sabdariffa TaxID=183260 RepID=A0ABR2TUC9_9ROSI
MVTLSGHPNPFLRVVNRPPAPNLKPVRVWPVSAAKSEISALDKGEEEEMRSLSVSDRRRKEEDLFQWKNWKLRKDECCDAKIPLLVDNVAIDAFGRDGDLKQMEYLFRLMRSERTKPSCVTLCSLLRAYGRMGCFAEMKGVLEMMKHTKELLDLVESVAGTFPGMPKASF